MLPSAPIDHSKKHTLRVKARQMREKLGPHPRWAALQVLLADRKFLPVPCEIVFDADLLLPGEFAHTVPTADSYLICIHPVYADQNDALPLVALQQLALVLGGPRVSPEEAEEFGATCLGLSREEYYAALCELAAQAGGGDDLC